MSFSDLSRTSSFILSLFLLLSVSCSVLPISEDTKEILGDVDQKILQGPQFDLKDRPELHDKKVHDYLKFLVQKITHELHASAIDIVILDTDVVKGLASERTVFLSKGVLFAIQNEAELVAFLGHEVGHIQLKHVTRTFEESKASGVVGEVVEQATGLPVGEDIRRQIEKIRWSQFSQQKEQEADEFGVQVVSRLGYDPFAFADLFDRLSQRADPQVFQILRKGGSHLTLAQRAAHLRAFLKEKGLKKKGMLGTQAYLKSVRHLANSVLKNEKARQEIDQISQELTQKGRSLTVQEFLEVMERLRSVAKELNLLGQLDPPSERQSSETTDDFMMELVRISSPLWAGQDPNMVRIRQILGTLGRMAVGAIPLVGDAIDLDEVLTGRDFYTHEPLTYGERAASALGLLAATGQQWRSVAKGLEVIGEESKGVREAERAAREAVDEAPLSFGKKKILDATGKIDPERAKEAQRTYRQIKNPENEKVLKDLAADIRQKKFPEDWKYKVSEVKGNASQGWEAIHPDNDHIRVRVMPGNPKAEFPNSQAPYVVQRAHGKFIDSAGNVVGRETNEAHIPLKDYKFWEFWKGHGKK